ncbi:MAG TPA: type VI secretion system tip protein TssI/VgrG [Dyella sp.]|uniref:type VI secretion system Vgr family protein n=1 Tax=Dyella sp. TaxID=1869338 RepID=UPI002B5E3965|nr:type VI secretion system tip protein TssI/VgrG [Dyella sp.]HTV86031.1 type VI secretion system tip protein TssI/VgrG [Dyella sp.]
MSRQTDLRFTFQAASGPALEVIEFHLDEALCEPYVLTLELASAHAAIDFGQLLDQPAVFTLWRGEHAERIVHGMVSAFEQGDTGHRRTRYRAIVEPMLARMGLRSDWRIFQQQTAPQILRAVLKRSGIADVDQRLNKDHLPREYCVQPGETDLDFFTRLSAEEGLYYAFEHSPHGHTLIQGDVLYTHGVITGGAVTYNATPGGDQAEPCLRSFRYTEHVRTAAQTQKDYTFKHPRYGQSHTSTGSNLDHQSRDYERYDYPGRYKQDEAGKPFTQTRLLALRRDAQIATIEGDDARLQPGLAFDLQGHPREDWNTGWRTVRMVHTGTQTTSQAEESADATTGTRYRYIAQVIPDRIEWKASLHPKPRIDGPQMATVVGPRNEEIFTDEYGRVKVQFPWDRQGQNDEHSSCWIRVSQNWAGAAWGHIAIPRIGHEVIVSYVDGDCDQPIITGRTYPATNPPPYALPKFQAIEAVKSKELKGNRANELRIDDTPEQISAALMSDHGATALHLGYLTQPRPQGAAPRGEGFELRTDEHGALRAAKGLLLSTDGRVKAQGGQLSRAELVQCLESALELAKQLGDYAGQHQNLIHDARPQQTLSHAVRDLGHGANDESQGANGGLPLIALSSPAGIAAGTPQSITLAAGQHVDSVAQQNQQITAGQALVMNAGQGIGFFAQGGELKQIAHQGDLTLQAQQASVRLEGKQSVELYATDDHILAVAGKHLTLMCGGAYIKLEGGNMELGCPGELRFKAGSYDMEGAASAQGELPQFDVGDTQRQFRVLMPDGERPVPDQPYSITSKHGEMVKGVTNAQGVTQWLQKDTMQIAELVLHKTS